MSDLKIYEPADEPSDGVPVILPFPSVQYVPREWVEQYRDRLTQLNNED
jgi:hypothetical protein